MTIGVYEPEKSILFELRRELNKILEEQPEVREFTKLYVPQDKLAEADPETLERLAWVRQINESIKALRERRAEREKR